MLGRVIELCEEMKGNKQHFPQRSPRSLHEVLMAGFRKEQLERDLEEELEDVSHGALRILIMLKYKIKLVGLRLRTALLNDKINV